MTILEAPERYATTDPQIKCQPKAGLYLLKSTHSKLSTGPQAPSLA